MLAAPLQQHPSFARAVRAMGQRVELLAFTDGVGTEAGAALAVYRWLPMLGEVGSLIRGPTWDGRTTVEARAAALFGAPVHMVEAEAPCPSLRLAGFRQVATTAHVAEIDLRADADVRRGALRSKWRGHLCQAERNGLSLVTEVFDGDPGHWLLVREAEMRRTRGYRTLPQALASAYAQVNPGMARLYLAHQDTDPVAAMLFLLHTPVATYHIGWTGPAGRLASAHHLLLMRATDDLSREGFHRLDLGTVDTDANPGLARFKIGAGARVRPLGGSWLRLPLARRLALLGRRG